MRVSKLALTLRGGSILMDSSHRLCIFNVTRHRDLFMHSAPSSAATTQHHVQVKRCPTLHLDVMLEVLRTDEISRTITEASVCGCLNALLKEQIISCTSVSAGWPPPA